METEKYAALNDYDITLALIIYIKPVGLISSARRFGGFTQCSQSGKLTKAY